MFTVMKMKGENIHMGERERRGRRKCPVISAACTL